MISLSTLCYLEKNGQYLMLHRTKEKNDLNEGKWLGVGGHLEEGESPEDCIIREVREETGYTLKSWRFRGILTFVSQTGLTEYIFVFTSDDFEGTQTECDEGDLSWVDIKDVPGLNLWEGDRVFLKLLVEDAPFFSVKFIYDENNILVSAVMEGHPV